MKHKLLVAVLTNTTILLSVVFALGESLTGHRNSTVTDLAVANGAAYDTSAGTPWRIEAEANIKRYRMGDINVIVTDTSGNVIPEATVSVEMQRHEWRFGAAMNERNVMGNAVRQRQFVDMFNSAVFENSMKWKNDANNVARSESALDWLIENGIEVRGHALIWARWDNIPDEITARYRNSADPLKSDIDGLKQAYRDRVNHWVPYWGDRVMEWDVINEPWHSRLFEGMLTGRDSLPLNPYPDYWNSSMDFDVDYVVEVLSLTKKLLPGVVTYVNDANLLTPDLPQTDARIRRQNGHQDWTFNYIDRLLKAGAELDGIGIQMYHLWEQNIEDIRKRLERFEVFGLEMKLTEYSNMASDPRKQAEDFYDLLTLMFSRPLIKGFIVWWPWDNPQSTWAVGGYFTQGNQLKPMGEVMAYLAYERWWTNERGVTAADGTYQVRGFYGDYIITVTVPDGSKKVTPVKHSSDKTETTVTMEVRMENSY